MKYLCLIFDHEKQVDAMSESECVEEHLAYYEVLRENGPFVAAEALAPIQSATTVRVRNGKLSTTDGPFVETKEQLGGFYLIAANDLNEAIQVAAKIPSARTGSIEGEPDQAIDPVNRLPGERLATDGEAGVSSGAHVAPGWLGMTDLKLGLIEVHPIVDLKPYPAETEARGEATCVQHA